METDLRILILEDNPVDAQLAERELRAAGIQFTSTRVETREGFVGALDTFAPELILSDYSLPSFDGAAALEIARQKCPEVPFIFVSGAIGEDLAIEVVRGGATDYVLKDRLHRLAPVVERALAEAKERAALSEAEEELRVKNEELVAMTQQLWHAAKLATMGELAASIAHELNNPLATVTLRVESLLDAKPQDDPDRRSLEVIDREVERMGNLVSNLLEFSRRSTTQVSSFILCEEISNTLILVEYHLRKRNIAVVKEYPPDGIMIQADRQQIRQLFLNLFTNASDAMEEGGTLTIRVGERESGREEERENGGKGESPGPPLTHSPTHVSIEISDTGVGIPPENLSKITEAFFTTKEAGKGTGLGMPICKRIAEAHKGTLDIESQVGKGTTVRITLPVRNGTNGAVLREE